MNNREMIENGRAEYAYKTVTELIQIIEKKHGVLIDKKSVENQKETITDEITDEEENLKKIDENRKNAQNDKEKYRSRIIAMPMMIKTNGFGTTMAFYFSKRLKEQDYQLAYEHIEKWLVQQKYLDSNTSIMEKITSSSIDEYKLMMSETMALLEWMKRFVEGLIIVEKSSNEQDNAD